MGDMRCMSLPTANLSSPPAVFLRHKPLFILTVCGEPKPISERLFRSIYLSDKSGLVGGVKNTSPVCAKDRCGHLRTNYDRGISSIDPQVA
jgi:hypothetical protein